MYSTQKIINLTFLCRIFGFFTFYLLYYENIIKRDFISEKNEKTLAY